MSLPQGLNEAVRGLLLMSAAGAGTTLLVFLLKPLIQGRLPQRAQYRLWALALMAFLIPFFALISLPFPAPMAPLRAALTSQEGQRASQGETGLVEGASPSPYAPDAPQYPSPAASRDIAPVDSALFPSLSILLLAVGGVRLLADATAYALYAAKLRRRRLAPRPEETAKLQALCGARKGPRLYRCPLAATPMVLGLFHPVIYLPAEDYTAAQLDGILLHEFTHWRHKDVAVKWLCALVLALHWFNPAAYLVRRQLHRACELACDEAAIRDLDSGDRQRYGDTLIALAAGSAPGHIPASAALWEEKKALKERLGAIMAAKAPGKTAALLSWALPGLLLCAIALFSASGGAIPAQREGVSPYPLTQDQQDVLAYLGLSGSARLFSYAAPPEAASLRVDVYSLADGRWQSTGGGGIYLDPQSQPAEGLEGVFAMTLGQGQAIDFRILSPGGTSSYTCPALPPGGEFLSCAACFLDGYAPVVLDQELPVALLVYHNGYSIPHYSLQSFFDPSPLSSMDLVQAVTLTFSSLSP